MAQDEREALIFAHPTPSGPSGHLPLTEGVGPGPHYGGTPSWEVVYHFRRAKSEWPSAIQSGPLGPGFAKIAAGAVPLLRLGFLANGTGPNPGGSPKGLPYPIPENLLKTRRGGACPSRPSLPLGEGAPVLTLGWMRGTLPITLPLRFPVGAAHWAARVCRPYGNRGMFQRMPSPEPNLSPTRPKGALPTDRSTDQRLPRTQRQR